MCKAVGENELKLQACYVPTKPVHWWTLLHHTLDHRRCHARITNHFDHDQSPIKSKNSPELVSVSPACLREAFVLEMMVFLTKLVMENKIKSWIDFSWGDQLLKMTASFFCVLFLCWQIPFQFQCWPRTRPIELWETSLDAHGTFSGDGSICNQ